MDITIRDKTFRIDLVNNASHKLYTEMKTLSLELLDLVKDVSLLDQEFIENSKTLSFTEKRKLKKEFKAIMDEYMVDYRKYEENIFIARENLIKNILIKNLKEPGVYYEYDKDWWWNNTSPEDINDFIVACMAKDAKEEEAKQSKKK